jgi:fructose-specific PTS system IIA-like component
LTSHTAILARAAGVPLVVGAAGASVFAAAAGTVVADAQTGLLVCARDAAVHDYYLREQAKAATLAARFDAFREAPASMVDGRRIEVSANIALADEAGRAFASGAEGIGLFRTEMLFMDRAEPPSESEQFDAYRQVLETAAGRPVIVRTFDIGGDKPAPWLDTDAEDNPFLGVRGVRLYRRYETVFETQLTALARAARYGNLRIMIPMIGTVEELSWVRDKYESVREKLRASTRECGDAQLGIMIEVPAAAFLIDRLAELCDFISIGTNDLTQYFLACDRGNRNLESLCSSYQPSFLRLLNAIVGDAREHKLWVGVCGEMAGDEAALPIMAGLGVDEISMSAPRIARGKAVISQLDGKACRDILQRAMNCDDAESVLHVLRGFWRQLQSLPLLSEELIVFADDATTKAGAIKRLIDVAHLHGRTDKPTELEEAVWQREDMFSTGLGFGIAVPHCKSDAISHNSLCIARFASGIDWASRDGEPVDTVLLLLIRETDAADDAANIHLKIFAELARKIMHEEFRSGLRACDNAEGLIGFLQGALDAAAA